MNIQNKTTTTGRYKLDCFNLDGSLKWSTNWIENTITNTGKAEEALLVSGEWGIAFTYLAVGTDSTAAAATQTALEAETTTNGLERAAATVTLVTTTTADDTMNLEKTWTASWTVIVEEIGIFNAASAGIMLGRQVTGTKTINSGESLQGTYQIIFS